MKVSHRNELNYKIEALKNKIKSRDEEKERKIVQNH